MRCEYEMSDEQYKALLEAFKPTPVILIGGIEPMSAQRRANIAWQKLGAEIGFRWETVQPCGKGDKFFTAEAVQ